MKLNLNRYFTDIEGKKITESLVNGQIVKRATMAQDLAKMLFERTTRHLEPMKAHDFALKLYSAGEIEIDATDMEKLENDVREMNYITYAKVQLLKALKDAKEAAKDAPKVVRKKNGI